MKKNVSMSRFNKIVEDIKSVKIQGAENVAKAGIMAFLLSPSKSSAKKILSVRTTEPLLQNSIKTLVLSKTPALSAKKLVSDLEKSHKTIAKKGSKLIKNGMNVYTHCHSSTVMDILKYAKKQGKNFTVYTSEVEPLLQGHKTAKDLAKSKIKVIISSDLAVEQSIKKCELFLFGADAFTSSVVVNKMGTNMLTEISNRYKIPTYSCGVALKFTKKVKIEKRAGKELWDEREKNIHPINFAFDKTKLKRLSGVVSEFGILSPREFVKRARKKLKKLNGGILSTIKFNLIKT